MSFRRPQLIPTLFILAATALLVSLGAWQLQRLGQKEALIAQVEAAKGLPPLEALPAAEALPEMSYRRVALPGSFRWQEPFKRITTFAGGKAGYFFLLPFELDDGRLILVNRGFVPAKPLPEDTVETQTSGIQILHGVLRPAHPARTFTPKSQPENNLWFSDDLEAMSAATGAPLLPLIIDATGTPKPHLYPAPGEGEFRFRNDHLGYAITWFLLALVGLVMFAFYHRTPQP